MMDSSEREVLSPPPSVDERVDSARLPRLSEFPKVCPDCSSRYPRDFNVCPRDATPLENAAEEEDPLLGTTLGDSYQIIRMVGEGGMGRVYEARHTRLGNKRFAVKVLHSEFSRQPDVVARFQREAETASGIDHPNVIDVFDVHRTADGRPYLVAEFLEGIELGELLKRERTLEPLEAVRILRQVCEALTAAHAREVVHRDMKPENIFLIGDLSSPTVKVLDFGISKVGDATGTALTRTGMIMGTPSYMAPEQARGEPIDLRADVYAAGGILYRCLTGKRPFDGDDPTAVLMAVLTQEPPRPTSIAPSIPTELELMIQHAMAKNRDERYSSMAEMAAALDAFLAHVGSTPTGPGTLPLVARGEGRALGVSTGDSARPLGAMIPAGGGSDDIVRVSREARRARPTLVALTGVGYAWLLGQLIDALDSAVLLAHREPNPRVERREGILVVVAAFAVTTSPLIWWARHLGKTWQNSVRAVALAHALRAMVMASLATTAGVAMLVRLGSSSHLLSLTNPVWSLALFGASVAGALGAYAGIRLDRRR